jgi:GDP-L-fucose synthase
MFLGSSCIYPRNCLQPIKEEYLLSDKLEATNEPYALAKICGIKLCQSANRQFGTDFRSVMPTNLYGPGDNFSLESSHVIPALIKKFHDAKEIDKKYVEVWGSGKPLREFLHVEDLAEACIHVMNLSKEELTANGENFSHINIGTGLDISIKDLSNVISEVVGYRGEIRFDQSKPDGTPRKLLDISKIINLGWKPKINLKKGLESTYEWYLRNLNNLRVV